MSKRTRLQILFWAVLLMLPLGHDVFGCTCLKYPSVRDAYIAAEGVFIGTVTRVEDIVISHKGQSLLDLSNKEIVINLKGWKTYFQIEKTYKGAQQNEVILSAEQSSCTSRYNVGKNTCSMPTTIKTAAHGDQTLAAEPGLFFP